MVPTRLGPYRLGEAIASRALTVTYRAEHAELGRRVLIKTLKPAVPVSSPFAQELEREARVLSALSHEGVVELHDFVRTPEAVWLVLEDPEGFPLSEVLERAGRLPAEVAAAIALEIARGLGHAHDRGFVHRELRPEHVQITRDARVKIASFAAAHDARAPSAPEPFEASEAFGRPDYMAPEQILGEDAAARADVFALGVVLYEMIAGARPFEGPEGADRREIARRIRSVAPPPLEGAPHALEQIALRCLAKRPDDRYENGRAAAAALEAALAERSRLPPRVLVSRALAAARLGDELPAPGAAVASTPIAGAGPAPILPTARAMIALLALIAGGGIAIELVLRDDEAAAEGGAAAGIAARAEAPGYVRVLARPWAEVFVDGELVDTTPMARSIPVAPGRHYVTFRHPNAPDEKRSVKIAAGQTVVLDVTMMIERPQRPDAGAPAALDAGGSP